MNPKPAPFSIALCVATPCGKASNTTTWSPPRAKSASPRSRSAPPSRRSRGAGPRTRRRPAAAPRRTIVRRRRRDLANHALAYLLICGSLTLVALFLTGGWWFLWPVILWGTGLVFHARDALRRSVSDEEARREFRRREREEERERRRLGEDQARTRRLARNEALERGADQLGAAVEKGVALLMSKVADKIRTGIRPDAGPSSPRPPSGSTRSDESEE
jgi:hypothetical protein